MRSAEAIKQLDKDTDSWHMLAGYKATHVHAPTLGYCSLAVVRKEVREREKERRREICWYRTISRWEVQPLQCSACRAHCGCVGICMAIYALE